MTDKTAGASQSVTESYDTIYDGFREDIGVVALSITEKNLRCYQVLVQNDPGNTNNMYVGSATSQSVLLTPGQSETLPYRGKVADIYVRFVAGANQRVNWHAMG